MNPIAAFTFANRKARTMRSSELSMFLMPDVKQVQYSDAVMTPCAR